MRLLIDIIEPRHQKETYLHMVHAKRIDGILLSGPRYDDEALTALQEANFPTVLLGQIPGSWFSCVDVDNRAAAFTAVAHLLKVGAFSHRLYHQRAAHLHCSDRTPARLPSCA